MNGQKAIQELLNENLTNLKIKNPSYSLRAFGKKLGIHHSALSEIINGKRNVSTKLALRIAKNLMLDPIEERSLLEQFPKSKESKQTSSVINRETLQLDADQFNLISEWYHFAILSLAETDGFESNTTWIAKRLGISKSVTIIAIERLLRLGLLLKNSKGMLEVTGISYSTTDNVKNLSLRKGHFKNLELAKKSLEVDSMESRDFTAMTIAIDPDRMSEAKELIRKFQDELEDLFEAGAKREVYKLCTQFIPLTNNGDNNETD